MRCVGPNDIALSPDGKWMYLSTANRQVRRYAVNPDGTVGAFTVRTEYCVEFLPNAVPGMPARGSRRPLLPGVWRAAWRLDRLDARGSTSRPKATLNRPD